MRTLFLVHAHPDDESISTGGVMMLAKESGRRVCLVTCTRGEEGEIHNLEGGEALRPRLGEIRSQEMMRAAALLGVDRHEFLGYRDSGMAGTEANQNPQSFHQADLGEAAARLARILREERPQVVVTYSREGTYGHPDHVKSHLVTLAALEVLAQEGWEPERVFLHVIPESFVQEMGRRAAQMGVDVPAANRLRGTPDSELIALVDVRPLARRKLEAFRAHVSQMASNSPFADMGEAILEAAFGSEAFIDGKGTAPRAALLSDLFQGLENA